MYEVGLEVISCIVSSVQKMGCGLMETVERDHSKLASVAGAVGDEFLGWQGIKRMWYKRKMGALREIS